MSNENKQLIIPRNLALRLSRELRKSRIHFKRLGRGRYQLVRQLYSTSELELFRRLNPAMQQIELIIFEDVSIVDEESDSLKVVDKAMLYEEAKRKAQEYLDTYWQKQQANLFESLNARNEQLFEQTLFRTRYFYGSDSDKSISALWGNTIS